MALASSPYGPGSVCRSKSISSRQSRNRRSISGSLSNSLTPVFSHFPLRLPNFYQPSMFDGLSLAKTATVATAAATDTTKATTIRKHRQHLSFVDSAEMERAAQTLDRLTGTLLTLLIHLTIVGEGKVNGRGKRSRQHQQRQQSAR